LASSKIMRRAFGDVANYSGLQWNAAAVDTQTPPAFEHVADDVFIIGD